MPTFVGNKFGFSNYIDMIKPANKINPFFSMISQMFSGKC